jgi:hypothetical protein
MTRLTSFLCTAALASATVALSGAMCPAMALPSAVYTTVCTPIWTPNGLVDQNNVQGGTCTGVMYQLYDCAATMGCPAVVPKPGALMSSTTCPTGGRLASTIVTKAECQADVAQFCQTAESENSYGESIPSGCTFPVPDPVPPSPPTT